jgi:aspartate kinase
MTQYDNIEVYKNTNVAKVSVVGTMMRTQSGIAAQLFKLLADHDIDFMLVTTSEISISYIIEKEMINKAVYAISSYFQL